MTDDQFLKLFNHMNKRFDELRDELRGEIAEVDSKVGKVYDVLDGMAGDIQDIKTELAAHGSQHARYDRHITQLADHTGVKLQYQP